MVWVAFFNWHVHRCCFVYVFVFCYLMFLGHFEFGVPVQVLLDDIKRFLDDYPQEIVIVEISHTNAVSAQVIDLMVKYVLYLSCYAHLFVRAS